MARASVMQNAFSAGEFSPLMYGRQDISKYKNGLATCFNSLPLIQGGWTRRPGTVFLKTTKFGGTKASILVPFQFSVTQTYTLEFGDLYVRFFTNQGILTQTGQTPTAITQANPGVVTITGHGYSDGDRLHIGADIGGMHQLWGREVIVANKTANNFELTDIYGNNIDTTGYDAFTSGGTVAEIYEVVTPWDEDEILDLNWTQSADVLYLFHPDYNTRKLIRGGPLSWTISEVDWLDGPYLTENTTTTTLQPSAATGSGITITASAVAGINDGNGFLSTDVDRLVRIKHGATWGYAKITAVGSTTSVTADVKSNFGADTAQSSWRLGSWSDTTGWPVTGTFYEDRFWGGGPASNPQRIDGSRTGDYENMAPSDADGTVADDHAVAFTLNSNDVNNIVWMKDDEKALLVGTTGGEWPVRPSSLSEAITPTNIAAKRSTRRGSANIQPVQADNAVLFVQRAAKKLREIAFSFERDGFASPDMTLLAENITSPGIASLAYAQQPQSVIWAQRTDGAMLGFTYERSQDVVGWHRHELGGDGDNAGGIAEVESVAVVPSASGDRDELYLIVKRYINSTTERYVEVMSKLWEPNDNSEDAFYVDCGITELYDPADNEVLGLWHLEGETISVWIDGALHPDKTVTNGKIDLDSDASTVSVGYAYDSDGETLPIEAGAADGSAQGKLKRIYRIGFWLLDTLGLKYGPDAGNLQELLVRNWGGSWGVATPLFTGVARVSHEGDHDRIGQIYWRSTGPAPCNVLAVMLQVNTQDDT